MSLLGHHNISHSLLKHFPIISRNSLAYYILLIILTPSAVVNWTDDTTFIKLLFIIHPSGVFFFFFHEKSFANKIKPHISNVEVLHHQTSISSQSFLPAVSTPFDSLWLCPVKWYEPQQLPKPPCLIIPPLPPFACLSKRPPTKEWRAFRVQLIQKICSRPQKFQLKKQTVLLKLRLWSREFNHFSITMPMLMQLCAERGSSVKKHHPFHFLQKRLTLSCLVKLFL